MTIRSKNMKVVILAGGMGTRISEESHLRPKPMIEIGNMPIIWHIMKIYSYYGFNDFIIAAGYKQEVIKQWFVNYLWYNNDIEISLKEDKIITHRKSQEDWNITIVDTGLETQTGGRILRLKNYIGDEPFMVTYGDGVADIDLRAALMLHEAAGRIGTISTHNYLQNKGVVEISDNQVKSFREKSETDISLINIGFMIFEPEIFDYLKNDKTILEKDCLPDLAAEGQLTAYHHEGFWQCMDTIREKKILEEFWNTKPTPWEVWRNE